MIHLRIVAPTLSSEPALGPLCVGDVIWLEGVAREPEGDDRSWVGRSRYSSRVAA